MHAVIIILGALLGAMFESLSHPFFGAVVGALAGLGVAEWRAVQKQLRELRHELFEMESELRLLRYPTVVSPESKPNSEPEPVAEEFEAPAEVAAAWAVPLSSPASQARSEAEVPHPEAADAAPRRPPERRNPLIAAVVAFFTGGNTLVRSGIVVLFFGVAFLLRYAAEHTHVPIELRLSGVAAGAMVLLVLGWRLRKSRAGYAFALQGGGVGILYLTVFAAMRLYGVLPPIMAFVLLACIAALAAALAVLQNSQAFALLGVSGGFLAPVLASTGQGSHVTLFSYFLVLNAGIVVVAWFKSWRALNVGGFIFTFAIATTWGVLQYRSADFASTEPFLVLFFLLYLAISVLFALRQPLELRGYVDGTLVFGTPFAAFALQTAMLHQSSLLLAYTAVGMSAVYLSLAFVLRREQAQRQALLIESFLALGVVFLTLAIPLALGNRLNSAAWSLEGVGLIFIGLRQERRLARALGTLLIIAAGVLLMPELTLVGIYWVWPSASYAAIVLVSAACMFATREFGNTRAALQEYERLYRPVLFVVGLLCWCIGTQGELHHWMAGRYLLPSILAFYSLTALLLNELGERGWLPGAGGSARLFLPVAYILCGAFALTGSHPFLGFGWAAWPTALTTVYYVDWHRRTRAPAGAVSASYHSFALWLGCIVLGWELAWQISNAVGAGSDWHYLGWVAIPALYLLGLRRLLQRTAWPFGSLSQAYRIPAALGLAIALALFTLGANASLPGDSTPLPYLPLLSPLDIAQMLVMVALIRYVTLLGEYQALPLGLPRPLLPACVAVLAFIACNGVLLRSLHHGFHIAFNLEALLSSNIVETSVSIFWSVLALITMLVATSRGLRLTWIAGAGLLVVVVVKLFFVDLSRIGSIERIVSFLGVGLLMLIIGYLSPLPPRKPQSA